VETIKNMEKLLIVIHVGIKNLDAAQVQNYFEQISKSLPQKEDGFFSFIIPDREGDSVRIECLNPVLMKGDEYDKVRLKLEKLNEKLKSEYNL
jgi:hypothetical protein